MACDKRTLAIITTLFAVVFLSEPTDGQLSPDQWQFLNDWAAVSPVFAQYLDAVNDTMCLHSEITCSSDGFILRIMINNVFINSIIPESIGLLTRLRTMSCFQCGLFGSIPASIAQTNLTSLSLVGNQLSGEIPPELTQMPYLTTLSLGSNKLTGTIPDFSNSLGLTTLSISTNFIAGSIPPVLFSLPKLDDLDLSRNKLSGTVPSNLTAPITALDISSNGLTGTLPERLFAYPRFLVDVSSNDFTGEIPASFASSDSINDFTAAYNRLSGTIPPPPRTLNVLNLRNNLLTGSFPEINSVALDAIDLSTNRLSGTLPERFGNATGLTSVTISNNAFSGTLPSLIGTVVALLDISINQFNGTLDALYDLDQLFFLDASSNQFTGAFLPSSQWFNIYSIKLYSNNLNGPFPELNRLPRPQFLLDCDISFNDFSGPLPDSPLWLSLSGMLDFKAEGNRFSGPIPPTLGDLRVSTLNLASNDLVGTIPYELTNNPRLFSLDLSNNKLNGTLPDIFSTIRLLTDLSVQFNLLTGTLPSSLRELKFLKTLYLNSNQFSGSFPSVIAELTSLEQLKIDNNNLVGTIPEDIGALSVLSDFSVENNHLSGTIPASLSTLGNLKTLTLQNNQLTGTIPESFNSLANLKQINLANNNFIGFFEPTMLLIECNLAGNNLCCGDSISPVCMLSSPCSDTRRLVTKNETISLTERYQSLEVAEGATLVLNINANVQTQCLNVHGDIVISVLSSQSSAIQNELDFAPLSFAHLYQPLANTTAVVYKEEKCRDYNALMEIISTSDSSLGQIRIAIQGSDVQNCSDLPETSVFALAFVLGLGLPLIVALIVVVVLWRKGRFRRNIRTTVSAEMLAALADKTFLTPISSIKFERELGSGSFGKVFIGKWRQTTVAFKVCNVPSKMEEFMQEAALMMKLTPHPNVVQLLAISIDGPEPVIVLEYCDEGSLDTLLFDSQTHVDDLMRIKLVSGIARGMLHLHKNNLVHRDLAARNVLLQRGVPKVSDFGMSRLLQTDNVTKTYSNIGPIRWMAPESLKSRTYSTKSDVWMFGIVLTEIVAQSEPHVDKDPLNIGAQIRDKGLIPNLPETMNPLLKSLIDMCLHFNPDDRPDFEAICQFIDQYPQK